MSLHLKQDHTASRCLLEASTAVLRCPVCAAYAQIASWVAQASFKPLGLSIAVAKDRAIESLMQAWIPCCPLGVFYQSL